MQAGSRTALVVILSAVWFPHSLSRVKELGYDFPIYLQGPSHPGWLYKDYLATVFVPFQYLPFDLAFGLWYAVSVLAWLYLLRRLPSGPAGTICAIASIYPALLCLELGQITPVLAALCLSPLGVVLATLVKPYLACFLLVHAIRFGLRQTRRG